MSENIVTCHGLHKTSSGVHYLHQGGKSYNFITLRQPSPFRVEINKAEGYRIKCPHAVNPNAPMPDEYQWKLFLSLYKDELFREFLPIPRDRRDLIPFLPDPNKDRNMLLFLLSRLSSPIQPIVHPFAKMTLQRIEAELGVTNICPLILTDIETEHQRDMEAAVMFAQRSPRKLILVGDPRMVVRAPMERVQTYIDGNYEEDQLYSLPMENLGAVAMRRYARGEQIDAPWVRKDV